MMSTLTTYDPLLSIIILGVTIFLPKLNKYIKTHLDFLVGGTLNLTVSLVILILLTIKMPLTNITALLLLLESHIRVDVVEHFRTYFGLQQMKCDA